MRAVETAAKQVSDRRSVSIQTELINADSRGECKPELIAAFSASCRKHGQKSLPMVSRAYHDTLFMARVTGSHAIHSVLQRVQPSSGRARVH